MAIFMGIDGRLTHPDEIAPEVNRMIIPKRLRRLLVPQQRERDEGAKANAEEVFVHCVHNQSGTPQEGAKS